MSSGSDYHGSAASPRGLCFCGIPVGDYVSWTEKNPGRRFKKCKLKKPTDESNGLGCSYWTWVDPKLSPWNRDFMNSLIQENKQLKTEVVQYKELLEKLQSEKEIRGYEATELSIKLKRGNEKYVWTGFCGKFMVVIVVVIVVMCIK